MRLLNQVQLNGLLYDKAKIIDKKLKEINDEFHYKRYNRELFDKYLTEINTILIGRGKL